MIESVNWLTLAASADHRGFKRAARGAMEGDAASIAVLAAVAATVVGTLAVRWWMDGRGGQPSSGSGDVSGAVGACVKLDE